MKFNLIAIIDRPGGIGFENNYPWKFDEYQEYFQKITTGKGNNAVIMGKSTYENMKFSLQNTTNILISSKIKHANGIHICTNMTGLFKLLRYKTYDTIWVIGGFNIYKQFLIMKEYIDNIHP